MILYINNKSEIHTSLNYLVFLTTHDGNTCDPEVIDHTKFRDARNKGEASPALSDLEGRVQDEEGILAAHQRMISGALPYIYVYVFSPLSRI